MQAKLAVAEAAAQEGAEKAGGALVEAQGQIEAALGRAHALEADCSQLRRSETELRALLESAQAECSTRAAELQAESERRTGLDLELARSQEALDESKMLHQALQQQHAQLQVCTLRLCGVTKKSYTFPHPCWSLEVLHHPHAV